MANKPNFIDVRSHSSMSTYSRPLRSPRMHIAGEAPPELSPLDAFALQSRILARQLEEGSKDGKRVSRLPPLTHQSPVIVQGRSDYFRSLSGDSSSEHSESEARPAGLGLKMESEDPDNRPMSMHPRLSRVPEGDGEGASPSRPSQDGHRNRLEQVTEEGGLFGVGDRTGSPEPMDNESSIILRASNRKDSYTSHISSQPSHNTSFTSQPSQLSPSFRAPFANSPGKVMQQSSFDASLAPPRPFFPSRSGSAMSHPLDPSSEDPMSQSFHSLPPRKMSTASSAFGGPSPIVPSYQRSPSISSEMSAPLPKPSFNFSRPMSRSGTPGPETPSRQESSDSTPSFLFMDDSAHTPVSMSSEGFPDASIDSQNASATSYIYSKFVLPRGKNLQHAPGDLPDTQLSPGDNAPLAPPPRPTFAAGGPPPPSPPTRPTSSSGGSYFEAANLSRPSTDRSPLSQGQVPQASSRPSTENGRVSEEAPRGRIQFARNLDDAARARTPMSNMTQETSSTIKHPPSKYSIASASDMTAEEHLEKGIDLHENGSLNESSYHLRHAARGGHPTGMLLFALACRHGWGMRPNQREGVEWLRRAAECASVEIADEEEQIKGGKTVNAIERRTRKAQFALSIYELGVSHMNGWGLEQDKSLGLRCFEIAGSWGDIDALAEAGFCYAKGVGCKKDLKKSAKFYRQAEAKGMSMVGNSWIHKSKYDDATPDKKARSKSRSRGLFGSKKQSSK